MPTTARTASTNESAYGRTMISSSSRIGCCVASERLTPLGMRTERQKDRARLSGRDHITGNDLRICAVEHVPNAEIHLDTSERPCSANMPHAVAGQHFSRTVER